MLTFEETASTYNSSLGRSYIAYLLGLIISTPLNFIMVEDIGLGIQTSWLLSILVSTFANYFFLKKFAFRM